MKPISDLPQQMTLAEALQWALRREKAVLANTELCLAQLRSEGVARAYRVDAETLCLLERNGLYYDFHSGKVERCL